MGQEIDHTCFARADFERFHATLVAETDYLAELIENDQMSKHEAMAGFEIEAWLVDSTMQAAPENDGFLKRMNSPLACAELARFNIELNNNPVELTRDALATLFDGLAEIGTLASRTAREMNLDVLMIGILPTLRQEQLSLANMSDRNRFRALNEQILRAREGRPLRIEIQGRESLKIDHQDVMLESATTSFQIHLQTPLAQAHHFYNAAIMASGPCVGLSANSPYLFGHELWAETRIPVFEQSIEDHSSRGSFQDSWRRVSFGSGYARESILECFKENLEHFATLLPIHFDSPRSNMQSLRLHNGTIWRWNRPLVGFDADATPHIRIEHRVMPAGPSLVDMVANAAFFYGLVNYLRIEKTLPQPHLPFEVAKDNFYRCAREGLDATIRWFDREQVKLKDLLLTELIAKARIGLDRFGITPSDAEHHLEIIQQRVESGQNGANWQRRYIDRHGRNFAAMTLAYQEHQKSKQAVHRWTL